MARDDREAWLIRDGRARSHLDPWKTACESSSLPAPPDYHHRYHYPRLRYVISEPDPQAEPEAEAHTDMDDAGARAEEEAVEVNGHVDDDGRAEDEVECRVEDEVDR